MYCKYIFKEEAVSKGLNNYRTCSGIPLKKQHQLFLGQIPEYLSDDSQESGNYLTFETVSFFYTKGI